MSHNIYIYILVMAAVTYLIRMLPLALSRKEITSPFIRSFLYYVPYACLAAMTFPAILFAPFGQPEDEVLADAQGTEDAAIDPSQEQGQDDDDGDDQEIPSQESRQDLPLRQHGCYDTSKGQDHGPHQEPR